MVAAAPGTAAEPTLLIIVTLFSLLPFVAAVFSLLLGFATLLRKKQPLTAWCFFAGMAVLGTGSVFAGLSLGAARFTEVLRWQTLALIAESFVPPVWLCFSVVYSRGNYRQSLRRWRFPLAAFALLPVGLSLGFHQRLLQVMQSGDVVQIRFGGVADALNIILLVGFVLILMNLEQTFRSAVGTMRWRIKFEVIGLLVIFGAHLYVRSQAILTSAPDMALAGVESSALLIGCLFLTVAYVRTRFAEVDVYPSRTVVRSSLTILIAGGYLFVVGILAETARRFGGAESFQFQAFVLLLGMAGLAVLLLSDRLRQRIGGFVGRHFTKAQHDSVGIWTEFSRRLASVSDQSGLCSLTARFISETFDVLSVTVWLCDDQEERFMVFGCAGRCDAESAVDAPPGTLRAVAAGLRLRSAPFELENVTEAWAEEWRRLNPSQFPSGGRRWCVPLWAPEHSLGGIVLSDRVNGAHYTLEERELLRCIAGQMTSALSGLRLADEVASAKELEAFRTMSAFFVHDLKNAAASLNLMLENLRAHFDDPAFRADALRGVGNIARRMDETIARLSGLRQPPDFKPAEVDLNRLVSQAVDRLDGMPHVELTKEFHPLPVIFADSEQIQSVVTNLVLNARDAVGPGGRIQVRTEHGDARVVLCVADNGCGMSRAFLKESLFRPFQTTKKRGLGIGMFQSRMIVERHGGSIQVESETGKGTTVRVTLPTAGAK